MNRTALGLAALGAMVAFGAQAQTQPPARDTTTTTTQPAARSDDRSGPPIAAAPLAGANSFTEGQARSRIEEAGVTGVASLEKDEHGVWRGRGTRNGQPTEVALDYRGNVVIGAGAARGNLARTEGDRDRTATGTTGTTTGITTGTRTTTGARTDTPDGTSGNPPSTTTGRAVDRAQGENPRPDGTPGNPPGTAAGRAMDRTLGTNTTGANPSGSNVTGSNPSGSNSTTGSGPNR